MNIVTRPMQIFTFGDPTWEIPYNKHETLVTSELVKALNKGSEIPPYVLAHLDYFPRLCGRLRGAVERNSQLREYIIHRPLCLLHLLLENYDDVAEQYEEMLLGNGMGEFIYELLAWSRETNHRLRKSIPYYLQFLTRDPYWGVRAARLMQREDFIKEIAAQSILEREKSASAAFFFLASNVDEPVEKYIPLFKEDAFYSVLALQSFYPRCFTARGINPAKISARWGYHFLVFGERAPEEDCERAVLKSPDWLVEYIMTKDLQKHKPERVNRLYEACVNDSHPHPLVGFLHSWFQRIKAKQITS